MCNQKIGGDTQVLVSQLTKGAVRKDCKDCVCVCGCVCAVACACVCVCVCGQWSTCVGEIQHYIQTPDTNTGHSVWIGSDLFPGTSGVPRLEPEGVPHLSGLSKPGVSGVGM